MGVIVLVELEVALTFVFVRQKDEMWVSIEKV